MKKTMLMVLLILTLGIAMSSCKTAPPKTETEAKTTTTTEPVTEPETEATTEPVTEPETEATTEPVTEPETEVTTEPVTELETETETFPEIDWEFETLQTPLETEPWPLETRPLNSFGVTADTMKTADGTSYFTKETVRLYDQALSSAVQMLSAMSAEIDFPYRYLLGFARGYTEGDAVFGDGITFCLAVFDRHTSQNKFIDFAEAMTVGAEALAWMDAHAWKYGMMRVADEEFPSGVYRFVGIMPAYLIKQSGNTQYVYEQFLTCLQDTSAAFPLCLNIDGNAYRIYYISASDANNAKVSVNADVMQICSDGRGGYIVTQIQRDTSVRTEPINVHEVMQRREQQMWDGSYLGYRLYVPEDYTPYREYPVFIFLHGAGAVGTDNAGHLYEVQPLFNQLDSPIYDSIVICPQAPQNWWHDPYLDATLLALEAVAEQYNIDRDRIYVGGLSMGGFGSWNIIVRYPDLFAAALPICGGYTGDHANAALIADMPIFVIHGTADAVVSYGFSEGIVNTLRSYGSTTVEFISLEGWGHNAWDYAWQHPEVLKWIYSHKLSDRHRVIES